MSYPTLAIGDPDRHAGFQVADVAGSVGADEEGVEVMVPDGARRTPCGEIGQPEHFRYVRGDLPVVRAIDQGHLRADAEGSQLILANIEAKPGLCAVGDG